MGDQPDVLWVWGRVDVKDDCVLLTGKGGDRCNFCLSKIKSDRPDVLWVWGRVDVKELLEGASREGGSGDGA